MNLDEKFSLIPENLKRQFDRLRKFRNYILAFICAWLCAVLASALLTFFDFTLEFMSDWLDVRELTFYAFACACIFICAFAFL
ncbi:hypothetical protein [Campylobacter sp.]|uniref:hypothetical protein n=1 Tax=Campylobacter sp. TaxID=205 RepID=UPI0026F9635E|nr:hypothetical protein [Campylobacter sp.]